MDLRALSQSDKIYFRPALFWQPIEEWQCADAGLEFRMNFTTRVNEGKFPGVELSTKSLERCKRDQLKLVPNSSARPDGVHLVQRLRNAATWQQPDVLEQMICTCYVTAELVAPCLIEAAKRNFVNIVSVLLKAGASSTRIDASSGMNALHIACEHGQEDVATLLVECSRKREDVFMKTRSSKTCFELARANDLGFMARRLKALVDQKFPVEAPKYTVRKAVVEDLESIYHIVNTAYSLEKGDCGVGFKKDFGERYMSKEEVFTNEFPPESFVLLEAADGESGILGVACCTLKSQVDSNSQSNEEEKKEVTEKENLENNVATFGPFAVHPDSKKKGIGTFLLAACEQRALEELKATSIEIEVINHRTDLFPWYQKRGFLNISVTRPWGEPSSVLARNAHFETLVKKI
jgi:GNAT superfamily N-acetyltransferase